jgi:prepilin-type N-terminal cleavage/methylation domain-containing protein
MGFDRNSRGCSGNRNRGFSLIEMLITVAVLIIVLGLMVSLARHVRSASANVLTRTILSQLDEAMAIYVRRNGDLPPVPLFIPEDRPLRWEIELQRSAVRNNEGFVRVLRAEGLLAGRFNDLSLAYYSEVRVLDGWGSPIVFMPHMHPDIGMNSKGWFFFSAGPDRQYLTRDDNLYSYDQPSAQQP